MKNAGEVELLLQAGRIVCPASGIDGPGAVAIKDGRIVASGSDISGAARVTRDFPDAVLLPGLVDLHAHPAVEGSKYGVDPDIEFLTRGVTTVLSQGDAGASTWARYRDTTIARSRARVRLAINLSSPGESMPHGCFEDLADADVEACVSAIEAGGHLIWGVSVNASRACCGTTDPREVVRRGVEVAERTGRPILYGMRRPAEWPFEEQLALLRPGDVVTYCFRGDPVSVVVDGQVHPAIRRARDRGVLFDVGHGMASFDFTVAETAIADGFLPDTISTDGYARHVGMDPPHDLSRTMAKLMAAGMPEADVFAAVTRRPAVLLGLDGEIGTLAPGACADLALLRWRNDAPPLVDVHGARRVGGCWDPVLTVRGGAIL